MPHAAKADQPGFSDWFQPTADLYVVGGGNTFIEGATLADAAGTPNTVFGGLGGQFFDVILTQTGSGKKRAGSGSYDVIVDECQNGVFDKGQDTIVRDAFVVDLDLDVPSFDNGLASFQQMKARARGQAVSAWEFKKMFLYADATEFAKKTASLANAVVGGLPGMLGFATGMLLDSLDPSAGIRARARTMVDDSIDQRLIAAYNLANDPPDPVFQTLTGPQRRFGAIPPTSRPTWPETSPAPRRRSTRSRPSRPPSSRRSSGTRAPSRPATPCGRYGTASSCSSSSTCMPPSSAPSRTPSSTSTTTMRATSGPPSSEPVQQRPARVPVLRPLRAGERLEQRPGDRHRP